MRGCFFLSHLHLKPFQAFPAYAGMFLSFYAGKFGIAGFPRVCGDVSYILKEQWAQEKLSPRMRGCFHQALFAARANMAFPAYAGMFLIGELKGNLRESFPRVCGDVSSSTTVANEIRKLSPRMRGCFSTRC